MLGVVFEEQEIFQGAMQRHLVRLDGHLIEPRQVKGGFVDTAVLIGELLLEIMALYQHSCHQPQSSYVPLKASGVCFRQVTEDRAFTDLQGLGNF